MFPALIEYLKTLPEIDIECAVDTHCLQLDLEAIGVYNPELLDYIIKNPNEFVNSGNLILKEISPKFVCNDYDYPVNVTFVNPPQYLRLALRQVGKNEINKLISITGLVTLISERKTEVHYGFFHCPSCEGFYVPTRDMRLYKPRVCPNCHGGGKKPVQPTYQSEKNSWKDVQKGVIQETFEEYADEYEPRIVVFNIFDTLVDKIKQGKKYRLTGVIRVREPIAEKAVVEATMERYFDVYGYEELEEDYSSFTFTEEEEKHFTELSKRPDIAEQLVKTISPNILGYPLQKYSLGLQMFGGSPFVDPITQSKVRGTIGILLIGDAGTAKSALAFDAKKLTPKSMLVVGKNVSSAGLGAATVKENYGVGKDNWTIKAGALILATGSTLIIDELDKINDADKTTLHSAMEQQIIKVDKAGFHAEFKCETSILACANPQFGNFDPENPDIARQFNISNTLLSRFDLIFVFRDIPEMERDKNVANFITKKFNGGNKSETENIFTPKTIQKYIAFAKKKFNPVLSEEAQNEIVEHYANIRRLSKEKKIYNVTARFCEATIRLSQAIAKLHYSNVVTEEHARNAVFLMLNSLRGTIVDDSYLKMKGYNGIVDGMKIDDLPDKLPVEKTEKIEVINRVFKDLTNEEGLVDVEDLREALISNYSELFPNIEVVDKELNKEPFKSSVIKIRSRFFKSIYG